MGVKTKNLDGLQRAFEDMALALTTSHNSGKTILSTKTASTICKDIASLIKVLRSPDVSD